MKFKHELRKPQRCLHCGSLRFRLLGGVDPERPNQFLNVAKITLSAGDEIKGEVDLFECEDCGVIVATGRERE